MSAGSNGGSEVMGDKERESKREQKTAGKRAIEIAHKKGQRHKGDIAEAIEDEIYRYIYIYISLAP